MKNIIAVDLEYLKDIPQPCSKCMYWQNAKKTHVPYLPKDGVLQKEQWFSTTLLEWGSCAQILKEDEEVIGYAQFGMSHHFPQSFSFKSGPVDKSAVFLACIYIAPEVRERKLGRFLLRSIIKECTLMGYSAIETYGKRFMKSSNDFDQRTLNFFENEGFRIVKDDFIYPRLRLDLKNTIILREEIFSKARKNWNPISGRRKHAPAPLSLSEQI